MTNVTVTGLNHATVTLKFLSGQNLTLAQTLANSISNGVDKGALTPVSYAPGVRLPKPLPNNEEAIISTTGTVSLPSQAKVVVIAVDPTIFGGGAANESVLAGSGAFTFYTDGGSGNLVAGDGNDKIVQTGNGPWGIYTGAGNDTIQIAGGNNTISAGTGKNLITLGGGNDSVLSTGNDTINVTATSGNDTINGQGNASSVLVDGSRGKANLTFIGGTGAATVLGGKGSATVFASAGGYFKGGTAGNNLIVGGAGATTIYGAGGNNTLVGGAGNDLVVGGSGNDTLVRGSGVATMQGGGGKDVFEFLQSGAGKNTFITDFLGGDKVAFLGYGTLKGYASEAVYALQHQTASGKGSNISTTITLSDSTQITFLHVNKLTGSDFS